MRGVRGNAGGARTGSLAGLGSLGGRLGERGQTEQRLLDDLVEFGDYDQAMANSGHAATSAFGKELQAICTSEPRFRNLDVRSVQTY